MNSTVTPMRAYGEALVKPFAYDKNMINSLDQKQPSSLMMDFMYRLS